MFRKTALLALTLLLFIIALFAIPITTIQVYHPIVEHRKVHRPLAFHWYSPTRRVKSLIGELNLPGNPSVDIATVTRNGSALKINFENIPATLNDEEEYQFLSLLNRSIYLLFDGVDTIVYSLKGDELGTIAGNYSTKSTRQQPVGERILAVTSVTAYRGDVAQEMVGQSTINFAADDFRLVVGVSKTLTPDQVSVISGRPQVEVSINENPSGCLIVFQPIAWKVGDRASITVGEHTLAMAKVDNPEISDITYPSNSGINHSANIQYLASGQISFEVSFTKQINKSLMTNVLDKQLNGFRYSADWPSPNNLNLTITGEGAGLIDLSALIDADGIPLTEAPSISFKLQPEQRLYSLNINDDTPREFDNTAFDKVEMGLLSPSRDRLLLSSVDAVSNRNLKYKSTYLYNVASKNLLRLGTTTNQLTTTVWSSTGAYFFWRNTVYTKHGQPVMRVNEQVLGAAFSPNGKHIALLMKNAVDNANLFIYEVTSREAVRMLFSVTAVPHSRPMAICWSDSNTVILEHYRSASDSSPSLEKKRLLFARTTTLVDEGTNPVISPDYNKLIYTNGDMVVLYDLESKERRNIATNLIGVPHWSPNGKHVAFVAGELLAVYSTSDNTIKMMGNQGMVVGWLNNTTLLLVK